ncbi:efflux RND transporter periplasmic adaptor subunit [Flavobacterium sp. JP2137]|uniref:efflux RND transporter periplasmic adaptor subunit n=1 Tax=Flavobacterium sp. JP2137 TaxID=3414510 RepID=UPI003D2FA18C
MKTHLTYLLLLLVLGYTSCDSKNNSGSAAAPSYPVQRLAAEKTTLYLEYPATLEGVETVEIRSKIDGYIEEVFVEEGSVVQAGQKLFKIDANRYLQDVNQRRAAVLAVEAALETASLQVLRTAALVDKNIVNSFELTTAKNLERVKKAELNQAQAALSDAQSQLAFTQIVSPISGVVGRLPLKKGSLVSSSSELALTTVANTSAVYAHFSLSQKQLNGFLNQYSGKDLAEKLKNMPEISLITANGQTYALSGRIQSLSGVLQAQTGSANFRALFPNPTGVLWSGASATLQIPTAVDQAILLPKKAVFEIQGRYFVYRVDAQNKAMHTEVQLLPMALEQTYVVNSGLSAGDIVVVDGLGTLRNEMQIAPKPIN